MEIEKENECIRNITEAGINHSVDYNSNHTCSEVAHCDVKNENSDLIENILLEMLHTLCCFSTGALASSLLQMLPA